MLDLQVRMLTYIYIYAGSALHACVLLLLPGPFSAFAERLLHEGWYQLSCSNNAIATCTLR